MIKTTIKEVTTDKPVLNVKYLNTFKNEYWSINEVNKLNDELDKKIFDYNKETILLILNWYAGY